MRNLARLTSLVRPIALACLLLVLPLMSASAAGQSTVKLTGQITDQTGVLDSGRADVQAALDDLMAREGVQLWVAMIPTTGGDTAQNAADATYASNGLGGNDLLLLVAVNDHRYGWSEDGITGLSATELNRVVSSALDTRFRAGDYPGGIVDFAHALRDTMAGGSKPQVTAVPIGPVTAPPASGSGSNSGSGDSGLTGLMWGLVAILLILIGIAAIGVWLRNRRLGHLTAEERDKRTGDLARQANKLLVDTDDAMHNAQQELGFAQAEFDDSDTAPFADAITAAQAELKKAFELKQQLDDSTPEDPPTRERMYGDIITHCQAANAGVDAQAKRLQSLRDLQKSAPQALAALPKTIEDLQGRLPSIQSAVKTLGAYAPSAWASVKGNPEEADKRGHFAEQQVDKGKAALAATTPDLNAAAHAARSGQEAVAQANQLLDAVEQMARSLDEAHGKLDAEIAAAAADIEAARAAAASGTPDIPVTASADIARADTLLQAAKHQASLDPSDPIAALKAVQEAHAAADAVLNGIREASSQVLRAKAAFDSARATAQGSVNQAEAFIAARSTGVGTTARTRLAEAQRHLGQADAIAATDVATATSEARVATNLANSAYTLASSDFTNYERGGPPPGGGGGGGGYGGGGYGGGGGTSGGGGSDIAGSILGGIIGGLLSGGGNRGGGFGGSSWGSGGGWTGGSHGGSFGGFGGGHSSGGGGWSGGGGGGGGGHSSGGGGW